MSSTSIYPIPYGYMVIIPCQDRRSCHRDGTLLHSHLTSKPWVQIPGSRCKHRITEHHMKIVGTLSLVSRRIEKINGESLPYHGIITSVLDVFHNVGLLRVMAQSLLLAADVPRAAIVPQGKEREKSIALLTARDSIKPF